MKTSYLMKATIDYTWLGKVENEARQSPYPKRNYLYGRVIYFYMFRLEMKKSLQNG